MGVSKVEIGGETVLDLTADTVSAENLLAGATAHNASGELVTGTMRISNPNLLDNWYFLDPINQRGQTEYVGAGYTIDRWYRRSDYNSTSVKTFTTLLDSAVKLTNPPVSDNNSYYFDFSQRIEKYKELLGKTVTISILVEAAENCVNLSFGLYYSNSISTNTGRLVGMTTANFSNNTLLTISGIISESIGNYSGINMCIRPYCAYETGGTITIKAAKVELGDTQTLAHQDNKGNWILNDPPPNPALELLKCQRYYQRLTGIMGNFGSGFINANSTKIVSATIVVPLSAPMRVIPKATFNGTIYIITNHFSGSSGLTVDGLASGLAYTGNAVVFPFNLSQHNITDVATYGGQGCTAQFRDAVSSVELIADL